jgi:hypothetical protein
MIKEILKISFPTLKKVKLGNFKSVKEELELVGIEYTEDDLLEAFSIASSTNTIDEALKALNDSSSNTIENAKKIIESEKTEKLEKEKIEKEKKEKKEFLDEQARASNFLYSIDQYQICSGQSYQALQNEVSKEMRSGWVPYGGVSTYNPGGKLGGVPDSFFQAMVRLK